MADAGLFATATRGGYDDYALTKAREMLTRFPGAYSATHRATGVPMDLLKVMHPHSARPPLNIIPIAKAVKPDDWTRMPVVHVEIRRRVTVNEIQHLVADHFGLSMTALLSERRSRDITRPRQMAMYLARKHTSRSLPEIGRLFGGLDHTTILHGSKRIEALLETHEEVVTHVNALTRKLSIGARRLDDMIARTERRLKALKAMRDQVSFGMAA